MTTKTNRGTASETSGLSDLISNYSVILSDVWGVLHNGMTAWDEASRALVNARTGGAKVVLITNAPRPSGAVKSQISKLGVPQAAYDAIVTSGDTTQALFNTAFRGAKVTHIGPAKDRPLVDTLPVTFTSDADAEVCLCSGLVDDLTETPNDYRDRLEAIKNRDIPLVCANPDKVVELGNRLIYCAGALADLYDEIGGKTIIVGKPYAPIYQQALKQAGAEEGSKVLVIGDSLRTDVKGAANQEMDCLFITSGIHAQGLGPSMQPNKGKVAQLLEPFAQHIVGWMPQLRW